jgi:hypothetical protein
VNLGLMDCPVHGQKGNREILAGLHWPPDQPQR